MKAALLFDQVCSLGPLAATSCLVKRYWRTMESQESSVGSREERGALGRKREGGVCVARARARERESEREREREREREVHTCIIICYLASVSVSIIKSLNT